MKKIILGAVCTVMVMLHAIPVSAIDTAGPFWIQKNGRETIITHYQSVESHVVCPDEYEGLPITNIYPPVFQERKVESIVLPRQLRSIAEDLLANQPLSQIEIPETVEEIGDRALSGCNLKTVTLKKVARIGKESFSGNQLEGRLTLPESVYNVGERAFADNPLLETIVLEGRANAEGLALGTDWNGNAKVVYGAAPILVTGIECAGSIQVTAGQRASLNAAAQPADAADRSLSYWSSSPSVAEVSGSGEVTGKTAGSCEITVSAQDGSGVSKKVPVTVSPAVPEDSTAEIPVEGEVKPVTTINVDVPVNVSFVIDEDRRFITQPFEIVNHSAVPVTVKAVSLKEEGRSAKVTAEDAYTDKEWNNLSAADTQSKIALGLETLADSNLLGTADVSPSWFASEGHQTAMKLGTIESAFEASRLPKISMKFVSKYGKLWDVTALRYSLILEFSAE